MEKLGLDGKAKELSVTGEQEVSREEWEFEELPKREATEFRALAARLNFLSQDSPELQYQAKEASREMIRPKGKLEEDQKNSKSCAGKDRLEFPMATRR